MQNEIAASGALTGAMCQGLMWIEFVMASKRMASVGHDLRLSAKILNFFMIGYTCLAVLLTVLFLTYLISAYTIWLAITALGMVVLSLIYL